MTDAARPDDQMSAGAEKKAYWIQGPSRMGWTSIYVVDEHGCLLNTEPACSVPDRYGDWFVTWLMVQRCPYPVEGPFALLEHVPSFPSPAPTLPVLDPRCVICSTSTTERTVFSAEHGGQVHPGCREVQS